MCNECVKQTNKPNRTARISNYLLQQTVGIEIVDIQQVCPPVLDTLRVRLFGEPQGSLAKELSKVLVEQYYEHVTWGQPGRKWHHR